MLSDHPHYRRRLRKIKLEKEKAQEGKGTVAYAFIETLIINVPFSAASTFKEVRKNRFERVRCDRKVFDLQKRKNKKDVFNDGRCYAFTTSLLQFDLKLLYDYVVEWNSLHE